MLRPYRRELLGPRPRPVQDEGLAVDRGDGTAAALPGAAERAEARASLDRPETPAGRPGGGLRRRPECPPLRITRPWRHAAGERVPGKGPAIPRGAFWL